jgi:hypothetical protein
MRTAKVWSYDAEDYFEKPAIGRVKYIGESFYEGGGLTNGKVYDCLSVEGPFLRIVDDEGMDYLYSITNPAPLDGSSQGGKWEVVEDDDKGTLQRVIYS